MTELQIFVWKEGTELSLDSSVGSGPRTETLSLDLAGGRKRLGGV